MKKYIGQKIAQGVSFAVRKTKQADAKVLNTVSKPFRKAQGLSKAQGYGMSVKQIIASNDANRLAAQRLVKPSYRTAQVLAATGAAGAGAYALNKKVTAEKKDAPKKGVVAKKTALQNSVAKPKSPNTVPPRAAKPVTPAPTVKQKPAMVLALPKPANKPKEKVLESKSKPRVAAFLPENKLGRAKVVGGTGNKETGYKKSSSTSRTGTKKTTGRFKK